MADSHKLLHIANLFAISLSVAMILAGYHKTSTRTILAEKKNEVNVRKKAKHGKTASSSHSPKVTLKRLSGLAPGAEYYYKPQLFQAPPVAPILAQEPMAQWADVMERFTRELSTDTMEIANLDNEVGTKIQLNFLINLHGLCYIWTCCRDALSSFKRLQPG
jgi:hypothetical protein